MNSSGTIAKPSTSSAIGPNTFCATASPPWCRPPVWHALSLVPFDVLSECAEHGGHIASRERPVDTLDELDARLTHGSPLFGRLSSEGVRRREAEYLRAR